MGWAEVVVVTCISSVCLVYHFFANQIDRLQHHEERCGASYHDSNCTLRECNSSSNNCNSPSATCCRRESQVASCCQSSSQQPACNPDSSKPDGIGQTSRRRQHHKQPRRHHRIPVTRPSSDFYVDDADGDDVTDGDVDAAYPEVRRCSRQLQAQRPPRHRASVRCRLSDDVVNDLTAERDSTRRDQSCGVRASSSCWWKDLRIVCAILAVVLLAALCIFGVLVHRSHSAHPHHVPATDNEGSCLWRKWQSLFSVEGCRGCGLSDYD